LVQEKKRGEVAIKILHENQSSDPILRERFLQEAHVLRKLEKTGVVPAPYTISPQSFSRPWFTMAYLGDMYRLRDMIGGKDHKRLTLDWAFPVAAALCESVDAIHRAGVVHRDLSPENVMYGFGSGMVVRLIDFDSAKLYGESLSRKDLADSMEGGAAVGKVKYTAPEQWANFDSAGPESDAYSVGVMIWEMVTGTPPFVGDSIDKIRECHRNAPREAAPLVHAGVPVPVAELIVSLINPVADRRATLKVVHSEMANLVKR
jgi:serine/threonine-protein kinase